MYEKHYVVQCQWHNYEPWETLAQQYKTLDEAKRAVEGKPNGPGPRYRVAESYVQIRYKAVKV